MKEKQKTATARHRARGWTDKTSRLRGKVKQYVEIRPDKVVCKSIKPVRER